MAVDMLMREDVSVTKLEITVIIPLFDAPVAWPRPREPQNRKIPCKIL
jgi:hypothetical protein